MASVIRLSRLGKVAALSAIGGSCFLLRDQIKQISGLGTRDQQPSSPKEAISTTQEPRTIDHLPDHVPYLLVGAGTASYAAMRAIRGLDAKAKVLMVGSENHSPYLRPALSKELWFSDKELRRRLNYKWWDSREKSIFFEIDEFFLPLERLSTRETGGVSLIKNMRLTRLDPDERLAYLENGQCIKYDKCLLAPGGKPKSLPELDAAPDEVKKHIVYFRTADDFLKLEKISETASRIAVIGGGFLGSELTVALSKRIPGDLVPKNQVIYQIFPEPGNLGKILPEYLSKFVSQKLEAEGAKLIPNSEVKSVALDNDGSIKIELTNSKTVNADYIVCAVGLEPDVELAQSSGLEVDEKTGGYLVNSELEARTGVWVAGDASCFYDIKLGRRRVEHHDHAINSGKQAGANMTGAGKAYTHQSMFWSDLGNDISIEAVGIIDSSLPTVSVFFEDPEPSTANDSSEATSTQVETEMSKRDQSSISSKQAQKDQKENDKYGRGIVFYLKDDVIVGILLWNIFSRLSIARRLLHDQKKYDDMNEVAKLFNVYLED